MYDRHNPTIAAYMQADLEGFRRGCIFAICSIRQSITAVPEQLSRVIAGDWSPLFGHKITAVQYLQEHGADLWTRVKAAEDNAARITVLLDVPGLGIVKAAFILQLMGYDVACLDSRNVKREGRSMRAFRSDGPGRKKARAMAGKVRRYLAEVEGHAAMYWDLWCANVARVYDMTPFAVSELHMAIVPDNYVPF